MNAPSAARVVTETHLIQKLRLSGIDVPENTANGAPEIILTPGSKGSFAGFGSPLGRLGLLLSSHLLCLGETFIGVFIGVIVRVFFFLGLGFRRFRQRLLDRFLCRRGFARGSNLGGFFRRCS